MTDVASAWRAWLESAGPMKSPVDANRYEPLRQRLVAETRSMLKDYPASPGIRSGLILATTKGDIDAQVSWMRSPESEKAQIPCPRVGQAAQSLADDLGIAPAAPIYVVSTACSSGLVALIDAAILLLDHHVDRMLVLGIDVAGDFVRDGFTALKALTRTACRPFDKNRDGLALGSGAAACLLARAADVAPPLACLSGWGMSSDAVHMTAPDRHARGLIGAIENTLAMAGLAPHDMDVILTHGTGTPYNDAMEATAIQHIFHPKPREASQSFSTGCPAVTALKGLIGHTLGASGIIESLLAVQMLRNQTIPPITGLQTPEFPSLDLVEKMRHPLLQKPLRHILKLASGFGGLNAAIILSMPTGREKT